MVGEDEAAVAFQVDVGDLDFRFDAGDVVLAGELAAELFVAAAMTMGP